MMSIRAIVVGGVDFGEADRVVHVLTAQGRASWFAHAAKKSRRRFAGALEPFTTVVGTLEPRRKQGMDVIGSLAIERSRAGLALSLDRLALASYLTELCARVAPEGEDARPIVEILERALDRLEQQPGTRALHRAIELVLLGPLGYAPEIEGCAACGAALGDGPIALDLARGGALCATHGADERVDGEVPGQSRRLIARAAVVGPKTRAWVRAVLAADRAAIDDPSAGLDAEWADTAALKIGRSLDALYRGIVDGPLRSRGLLDDVFGV